MQEINSQQPYFFGASQGLLSALDMHSDEPAGHPERVAAIAVRIGQEMGLPKDVLHDLETGALLHDVGKIKIHDQVLNKPSKLNDVEWAEMKTHPRIGFEAVLALHFPDRIAMIVLQHHEKYDGTGYPMGISNQAINPCARIFAVADAYDAITRDRVYRKGRTHDEAVTEITSCAGTHFDPEVAKAFARLPAEALAEWQ